MKEKNIVQAGKEEYPNHILRTLEKSGWNKAKAARILGISRGTLYKLVKQYDLEGNDSDLHH